MEIKPLSSETLEEAVRLANTVFPHEAPDTAPETAFRASLDTKRYKHFYDQNNIKSLEYWIGVKDQQVIGTVGLFTLEEDYLEAAWLGWFCVHPNYKGKGAGKKLLEFAIQEAQRRGNTYLRLSTKTENKDAHRLYAKRGFIDMYQEDEGSDVTFYKELSLGKV